MKTYFEYKGFSVIDYKDKEFAKYEVTNSNQCFDDLESAILYCIGMGANGDNKSQLMTYIDTFMTMIKK